MNTVKISIREVAESEFCPDIADANRVYKRLAVKGAILYAEDPKGMGPILDAEI